MDIHLTPIGYVTATRAEVLDDGWDAETASVTLVDEFESDALAGIDSFSHVEVIFFFDRVPPEKIERGARRPRGNPEWPLVGIFGQRGKNRPNRIGTTVCRVLRVEGRTLHLEGLDAVDGTPVLDIKPWMAEFGPRGSVHQPDWSVELMREYW